MAEQEALADLVEKASQESVAAAAATPSPQTEGESLLLPLLQGLLGAAAPCGGATADAAPTTTTTPDSGTESGEDQRAGLIGEVQTALDRLAASLQCDAGDVAPERRNSLLQLVTKLQAGLAQSVRPSATRRLRRRARTARHTVGVSSEELADARRLIEEISLAPARPPPQHDEGRVAPCPLAGAGAAPDALPQAPERPPPPEAAQAHSRQRSHLGQSRSQNNGNDDDDDDDDVPTLKGDFQQKPDLVMQTNPIYLENADAPEKMNRFNAKKLKMKRANTIDIAKPFKYYDNDDSDGSMPEDKDYAHRRRSNYLALRGPIRVGDGITGSNPAANVPLFEPKTENDKKFLAFINKHNNIGNDATTHNNVIRNSLWTNTNSDNSVWSNKFGYIKTAFEKGTHQQPSSITKNANTNKLKDFWRSTESPTLTNWKPTKTVQKLFETKEATTANQPLQPKLPWNVANDNEVVTGSLRVMPMNKFSHAPQSAFVPLPKKSPSAQIPSTNIVKSAFRDENSGRTQFLYCPLKPLNHEPASPPTKMWANSTSSGRVLNLAASKFESCAPTITSTPELHLPKMRKAFREKVFVPQNQQNHTEKLTAPFLSKSSEQPSNLQIVRKLSGQYNNNRSGTTHHYSPNQYQGIPQTIESNAILQTNHTKINNDQRNYQIANRQHYQNANYQMPNQLNYTNQSNQNHYHQNQQKPQRNSVDYQKNQINSYPNQTQSQLTYQSIIYQQPQQQTHFESFPANQYNQQQLDQNRIKTNNVRNQLQNNNQLNYKNSTKNHQQKDDKSSKLNHLQSFSDSNRGIINDDQNESPPIWSSHAQLSPILIESPNFQMSSDELESPPSNEQPPPPPLTTQVSMESLKEYNAVSSKVMVGPIGQQATTIRQKSPMSRDEHDLSAAMDLRTSLQKLAVAGDEGVNHRQRPINATMKSASFAWKSNDHHDGTVVVNKFQIPTITLAPEAAAAAAVPSPVKVQQKAESWSQICQQNQLPPHKPSPRSSPNTRVVLKSRSSHSLLALPTKQFEAGMSKEEMLAKKRSMEAFLHASKLVQPDATPERITTTKRSINRTKTSDKTALHQQQRHFVSTAAGLALARSRTLPDIVCPEMLDESNVDEAFEDLFRANL